jgi:hypothetical protein
MDAEAARGAGGVVGAAWGVVDGMGVAWGTAEVDKEVMKGRAIRPLGLVVGPPATGPRAV